MKTAPPNTVIFEGDGFYLLRMNTMSAEGGLTLYQIVATEWRQGNLVSPGTKGGYVTSATNLRGEAWLDEKSFALGFDVLLSGRAWAENTLLTGDTKITDNARVVNSRLADSTVEDTAEVVNSWLEGALVYGEVGVCDSTIRDGSTVGGRFGAVEDSEVLDSSNVHNSFVRQSLVEGKSRIEDSAELQDSTVREMSTVTGARLRKNTVVEGGSTVGHDALADNATITGGSTMKARSIVKNSTIRGRSVIAGSAVVVDSTVNKQQVVSGTVINQNQKS